ncbi:MAG: 16S rRNA (cytosine(1402)-N(4))-methyltransferase, partial [Rhodothermales bacterium]
MEHDEKERRHDATAQGGAGDPLSYASAFHAPVLCNAVIEGLVTDRAGRYVDATVGGGGHSAALLDALATDGHVVGIDQDAEALAAASVRLARAVERGRFRAVHGNFGDLERLLASIDLTEVDGLLLDLGVSSHQIEAPERGFSYRAEGALDMRMDTQSG